MWAGTRTARRRGAGARRVRRCVRSRVYIRNADRRFPFFWESNVQPAARGHGDGDGPAQYLADTPDGAWADFLRHQGITDPSDLAGVSRSLWAIEVDEGAEQVADAVLPPTTLL